MANILLATASRITPDDKAIEPITAPSILLRKKRIIVVVSIVDNLTAVPNVTNLVRLFLIKTP